MAMMRRGCPFLFLLRLLSQVVISVATSKGLTFSITFNPPYVHDLVTGESAVVRMTLNNDGHNKSHLATISKAIVLKSMNEEIVSISSKDEDWLYSQLDPNDSNSPFHYQKNFTMRGNFLGKTAICVRLSVADDLLEPGDADYKELPRECTLKSKNMFDVWVIQQRGRVVNHIFLSTLVLLIVIANVLMGCELDLNLVLETLKKPIPPLIGFCTQFIAMPLLAYSIATIVFMSEGLHSFALGLFVCGCAPGGGASNYWTLLLDGDLPVSITMTFLSTTAALVLMPAWMWALGSHFLRSYDAGYQIKMPYAKIISSLFTLFIPLMIGIMLTRWRPTIQTKVRKVMRPFLIFVLVFLVCFGAAANLYMFKLLTWTALLGGLLLPWCGFTVGCFASLFTRQSPKVVTAVAIETGIQNTGIAIMLLKFSFPEPDSDISALIPVICASFTPIPLLVMVMVHETIKYIKKRRQPSLQDTEATKKLNYGERMIPPAELIIRKPEEDVSVAAL
ncbi:unnamed protein product [Enterobius vermicularis]|uniref:Ileal sodium/bile acid cotransporter n=1 Tax=Enterobius vermicularis TaxID=51028 RepID=A0A0N4VA71_ENTVE|nr:unnamed protein product [Enterobius vermicularis]